MAYHLAGMWVNFLVSAALITWFVTRMSATVRARDAQLAQAREQQLQEEQIAACKIALDRMGMDVQVHGGHADNAMPVRLTDWLRHFVDTWRLRHPAISIHLSLPAEAVPVRNQQLIGQILLTLLDNAAQAVNEGGKIDMALSMQRNEAMIRVVDDGPGIAPDLLKRLGYEPVRSNTGGKGIGLMLAFATARQFGAKLMLTSDGGRGVCATLTVPL